MALIWANLPYLVGYLVQDSHHLFSGFFIFEQDGFSYLAKMRQGAQGSWLFTLPYTTEPHQGAFLYVFYLVTGKVSRGLGMSFIAFYHLIRVLGSSFLLLTAARFVTRFANTRRWRLLSWMLILFGGGTGWLISIFDPDYVSFASVAPDAFLYSVLFGPPHIIVGLAFLLSTLAQVPDLFKPATRSTLTRSVLLTSIGGLAVALTRPEYVAIALAVSGVYWLGVCRRDRRFYLRTLGLGLTAFVPALGYAGYVFWVSRTNPAIASWAAQNPFRSPPLPNLLADLGMLFALALFGILGWPKGNALRTRAWRHDQDRLLLTGWIIALPVLLYMPVSLNRRMIGGAQIALAIAAGYWLEHYAFQWIQTNVLKRAVGSATLVVATGLLVSYPLLFGLGATRFVADRPESLFLSPDEVAVMKWLSNRGGRSTIITGEETGNRIPAFSDAVPVLGHPIETLRVEEKRADVRRFYADDTDSSERSAILDKYQVDLVWCNGDQPNMEYFQSSGKVMMDHVFTAGSIDILRPRRPLE